MPTVLVNADDLCLHPDIDRGILQCIENRVVQSVSFSPLGSNLDWNRLHELSRGGVRVGLHVTLVGERWGTDGRMVKDWRELFKRILRQGKEMRDAVAAEVRWQAQQCAEHELLLAHIDSHQHVHVFDGVWQPVLAAAREHGIPRVRVPACPSWRSIKRNPGGIVLQLLSQRLGTRVGSYLPILGVSHAGHNTVAIYQREFAQAGARDVELCVHPGINTPDLERSYADWKFHWTGERDALLDPRFRETLTRHGYTLA
ncbi:MAG: carbohydrate deacetylase [Tepidisphaeraceae bacterium]